VSSPRLKDVLWLDAIGSDADVESYMSALQGAREGRSKPETYMERNPERGYRLLVNARAAVAEDLPKYNPPTRQVPDDPFPADVERARHILGYHHGDLMTNVEHRASAHWSATGMMTHEDWETMKPELQRTDDEAIFTSAIDGSCRVETARDGYDAFAVRTPSRIRNMAMV